MGELVRGHTEPEMTTLVLSGVEQTENLDSLIALIEAKEYANVQPSELA